MITSQSLSTMAIYLKVASYDEHVHSWPVFLLTFLGYGGVYGIEGAVSLFHLLAYAPMSEEWG